MKLGSGTYLANPNIFGKGEWKNILKIVLTIEYDRNGRMNFVNKTYKSQEEEFDNMVNEEIIQYKITK
jgi:hypothetical protein